MPFRCDSKNDKWFARRIRDVFLLSELYGTFVTHALLTPTNTLSNQIVLLKQEHAPEERKK